MNFILYYFITVPTEYDQRRNMCGLIDKIIYYHLLLFYKQLINKEAAAATGKLDVVHELNCQTQKEGFSNSLVVWSSP